MERAQKSRILVVDDDEYLREAIAFDFERSGYEVRSAAGGYEAFAILRATEIDLVVSDIRMPDGDGLWLLNQIQALPENRPPVIFITGLTDSMAEACGKGAFAIFGKPFNRIALLECVARALQPADKNWKQRPERIPVSFDVEVRFSEAAETLRAKTYNLSSGGMFVVLRERFPQVDSEITFKLGFISSGRPSTLEGTGIVRWVREQSDNSNPPGIGIEFAGFSGDFGKKSILELLDQIRSAVAEAS